MAKKKEVVEKPKEEKVEVEQPKEEVHEVPKASEKEKKLTPAGKKAKEINFEPSALVAEIEKIKAAVTSSSDFIGNREITLAAEDVLFAVERAKSRLEFIDKALVEK